MNLKKSKNSSKKNSKKISKKKINTDVAIIMGSLTDYKIMKDAEEVLKNFSVSYSVEVVSAHRTPEKMYEFAKTAHLNNFKVIIAAAGGAAHLPGMVASLTPLPVIGVPISLSNLDGLDSLLSIAQMPKGVPVATVAINNAYNAALLAVKILGVYQQNLNSTKTDLTDLNNLTLQKQKIKQLIQFQKEQKLKVKKMNQLLK